MTGVPFGVVSGCMQGIVLMSKVSHYSAALLLRFVGFIFIGTALVFSSWLVSKFDRTPPLELITAIGIAEARITFLVIGIIIIGLAELVAPAAMSRLLSSLFDRPIATKLLISFLVVCVPLTIVEVAVRPFTIAHLEKKESSLFVRDADLGWRLRPGIRLWGGVKVSINGKGLCGPEIPYSRDASKPRILYLGDSVTFGFRLSKYDQAYPFRIQSQLEKELGREVETVNTAVDGYSQWQEHLVLEREGVRYEPDIVILGFILNDVTERFHLVKFGGTTLGGQMSNSYYSLEDWLRHNSVVYVLIRRFKGKVHFGTDVQKGAAAHELEEIKDLAMSPEAPVVRKNWALTLADMDKIVDLCQKRRLPLGIVVFPFTFQFEDHERLSAPQKVLKSYCEARHIPCLDLLPLLAGHLQSQTDTIKDLFLDDDHLTARGSQMVAQFVVDWLRSEQTLWSPLLAPCGAVFADGDHRQSPTRLMESHK